MIDVHSVLCASRNGTSCDCGFDPPLTPGQEEILRVLKDAPLASCEARYRDLLNRLGVQGHDGAVTEISALRAELADLQDGYSRLSRDFALAIESDSKHIAELVAARRSIEIYQGCLLAEQEHSDELEGELKACRSKPQNLHLHANGDPIDCRTCAFSYRDDGMLECGQTAPIVCINGDAHVPTDPVRLYETNGGE